MSGPGAVVAGLCSVTFRSFDSAAVALLAAECGLGAIEWGGDVHVPPGDVAAIEAARTASDGAGVGIASYGSYLCAGRIDDVDAVAAVLDTAVALGAPNVRVWARGPDAGGDLVAICRDAADRDLTVSLEFHPGTRTETAASTNALLDEVPGHNLLTYWQPDPSLMAHEALAELEAVIARMSHLHVFSWTGDGIRLPFRDGDELWLPALRLAAATTGGKAPRVAFLEFVRGDDPAQLRADAATLLAWLGDLEAQS